MLLEFLPVKTRAGIIFSAWRNVLVASNMGNGVLLHEGRTQRGQRGVLRVFKWVTFEAFKFYANAVVIAVGATPVGRRAGMPGTVVAADKLPECAIAANIEVRRYRDAFNGLKVGVSLPVQLIGEKLLHLAAAIATWRQTDGMQHDQI